MANSYQLIDSGNFLKLEQVGPYKLVRPALGAVWSPRLSTKEWASADAEFVRNASGKGHWKFKNQLPETWEIVVGSLRLVIQLTDFGHLGLFAEQANNWLLLEDRVSNWVRAGEEVRVLNLFAYTGGSTLAAAKGGAAVTHLDASKTSVSWARKNAEASALSEAPIRWIVDDVMSFVEKELRRGKQYNGVILDPPSFGRGSRGQLWKIEEHLVPLLQQLNKLLVPNKKFMLLSSHSPGYTPTSLENLLREQFSDGKFESAEMYIGEQSGRRLPSGAHCHYWSE